MINILENIESIRKEKGIKQAEVGRKLGVSQTAYSNYVKRNLDIPFSRLELIAQALGVSVVDIITYPERWGPESPYPEQCERCAEKDRIISNLNNYIALLEKKVLTKK